MKEFSLPHCAQAKGIPGVCPVLSATDYGVTERDTDKGTERQRQRQKETDTQRKPQKDPV